MTIAMGDEPPEDYGSLTDMDRDILGEVFNVSMGAAAGAISTLLRMKVDITTPQVSMLRESDLEFRSLEPAVGVEINYIVGVQGVNMFILSQHDVMKIVDIWMGNTGEVDESTEFTAMHTSAVGELMNQMMGQSSVAMASLLNTVVDISPPTVRTIEGDYSLVKRDPDTKIVATRFKLIVGDNVIDSELIATCDIGFAKNMIEMAMVSFGMSDGSNSTVQTMIDEVKEPHQAPVPEPEPPAAVPPPVYQEPPAPPPQQQPAQQQTYQQPPPQQMQQPVYQEPAAPPPQQQPAQQQAYQQPPPQMQTQQPVYHQPPPQMQYQPVTFGSFEAQDGMQGGYMGNMNLIRRVPLNISAEIGRTSVAVREVLNYSEGTVIEFERREAEPIDIFANGVLIARGVVVVVEENFAVRIVEIMAPEELIRAAGV
jgi:flagellar motor switch protein FliN/FliY